MSVILKGDDGQTTSDSSFRIPARTWVIWIAILGAIIVLTLTKHRLSDRGEILSQQRFEELVDAGQIVRGTVFYDPKDPLTKITGIYAVPGDGGTTEVAFRTRARLTPDLEGMLLRTGKFEPREQNGTVFSMLWSLLPIVLIAIFIWFFFVRGLKKTRVRASISTDPISTVDSAQARFDKILDKWEEQAKRMDTVLDRLERERPE